VLGVCRDASQFDRDKGNPIHSVIETTGEDDPVAGGSVEEFGWIARLRASDPNAWEQFARRFGGPMYVVASRLLRSEEDRSDAVQDSFLSALYAIDRFEGKSKLGTWLHRIVVNACLMKLRASGRGTQVSIDGLLPQFDRSGHHARPIRRWPNAPDERLMREETRSLVRSCIDRLPDEYRVVLLLRDIEELSTDETAAILGTTTGAVKTRLHRARQALRSLLEPHFV
jgi:RNA polymerase sigma-70 factor, ECF subfamily